MQLGYSSLSLSLVCVSVTVLTARVLILAVQLSLVLLARYSILLKVLCSKVMASFTSSIGTAIYQVLFVVYSYPNDDTETATFVDRTVLRIFIVSIMVAEADLYPYEPVSVYYWLNEENPEVTCDPWLASYS